jgi:hypothetical protein
MPITENGIKGYDDFSDAEKNILDEIRAAGRLLHDLQARVMAIAVNCEVNTAYDKDAPRWASEGKTDLQKGIACLERAISRPQHF